MYSADDVIGIITECTDEALALIVVGGTMLGYFVGVAVPIELAAGVLAFYFMRKVLS